MLFYELEKVWRKKLFLIAAAGLFLIHLGILWFDKTSNEVPCESYRALISDLESMDQEERLTFARDYYQETEGILLVERVRKMELGKNESQIREARYLKEKNAQLYDRYHTDWRDKKYLRYTISMEQEYLLASELWEEFQELAGYQERLQEIQDQAVSLQGISIFSVDTGDSFPSANIKKTARDYQGMEQTEISYQSGKGVRAALETTATDVISLVFLLFLAGTLIFEEKEKGLFFLSHTTPLGGARLMLAKEGAMAVSISGMTGLFYGTRLLFYGRIIGYGDLSRSLQSTAGFGSSTLKADLGTYMARFILGKAAAFLLLGGMVLLLSLLVRHILYLWLGVVLLYGAGMMLYRWIPVNWSINWLKYLNAAALLNVNDRLGRYSNLNWFGTPVSLELIQECFAILSIAVLWCLNIWLFNRMRPKTVSASAFGGLRIQLERQKSFRSDRWGIWQRLSGGLGWQEGYKILWMNRGIFCLGILVLFCCYQIRTDQLYISYDEASYRTYMEQAAGPVTASKRQWLEREQERFMELMEQQSQLGEKVEAGELTKREADILASEYQRKTSAYESFGRIWEKYEYLQHYQGGWFVYDTGYIKLLDISGEQGLKTQLWLLAFCILAFGNVFAVEKSSGMERLLHATPGGREQAARKKTVICAGMLVAAYILIRLPQYWHVGTHYGLENLSAPVKSLYACRRVGSGLTIAGYLVLTEFVQLSAALVLMSAVLWFSKVCRNRMGVYLVSLSVLGLPVILYALGFEPLSWLSLLPACQIGRIIDQKQSFWVLWLYLCLTAGCLYDLNRKLLSQL